VIGRLKPDVGIVRAAEDMARVAKGLGVVCDVHQESLLSDPGCDLFVPIFQVPGEIFTIVARAKGPQNGRLSSSRSTPRIRACSWSSASFSLPWFCWLHGLRPGEPAASIPARVAVQAD
jgi:hypothetical protein